MSAAEPSVTFSSDQIHDRPKRRSLSVAIRTMAFSRKASHRQTSSKSGTGTAVEFRSEPISRHISFAEQGGDRRAGRRPIPTLDVDPQDVDPWTKQTALSLDGGGIRGICQLFILQKLMDKIRTREEEASYDSSASSPFLKTSGSLYRRMPEVAHLCEEGTYLPCHYFDYFCGTSTGGVIAILLGRLRMDLETAIESYQQIWTQMALGTSPGDSLSPIRKSRKINTTMVQEAVADIVRRRNRELRRTTRVKGSSKFVSENELGKTMILTLEVNKENGTQKPYLFRSYEYNERNSSSLNRKPQTHLDNTDIHLVAGATCAAPRLFSAMRFDGVNSKFRDGSSWTVNPAWELYLEMLSLPVQGQTFQIDSILSIGSGQGTISGGFKGIRQRRVSQIISQRPEQLLVHELLSKRSRDEGFNYFRLDGPTDMMSEIGLDDWKGDKTGKRTFELVKDAVAAYCEKPEVDEVLNRTAQHLVDVRHARCETSRWEHIALGIYYRCDLCGKERTWTLKNKLAADQRRVKSDPGTENGHLKSPNLESTGLALMRTRSSVQSTTSLASDGRRPSASSTSNLSDHFDDEDLTESRHQEQTFNYRDRFMDHLRKRHEAPWEDVIWKPIMDEWVYKRAHVQIR